MDRKDYCHHHGLEKCRVVILITTSFNSALCPEQKMDGFFDNTNGLF
jgi:hypothetical protein